MNHTEWFRRELTVGSQFGEFPVWNIKLDLVHRNIKLDLEKKRQKKETGHSRFVGGDFNKQGNVQTRLVLGDLKMSRSTHPPPRILSLYRSLNWFSHVFSPPSVGVVGRTYTPRSRQGMRRLQLSLLLASQCVVMSSQWPPPTISWWLACSKILQKN